MTKSKRALKVPEWWMEDKDVERSDFVYCDRSASDWIVSGPIGNTNSYGRYFPDWESAEAWAKAKYGPLLKGRPHGIPELSARWAFVVRRVKQ